MKAITTAIVLISFLFIAQKSNAQFYKDISVGVNAGMYIYQGDLTPQNFGSFKTIKPGFSLFAKKPINHFLAARVHISFAKLKGDDSRYSKPEYRQQRNFNFTTPVKEFSAQLVWNILGKNYEDRGVMPYLFSGAGVSLIRVKKDYSRMDPTVFGESSDVINGLAVEMPGAHPVRFCRYRLVLVSSILCRPGFRLISKHLTVLFLQIT